MINDEIRQDDLEPMMEETKLDKMYRVKFSNQFINMLNDWEAGKTRLNAKIMEDGNSILISKTDRMCPYCGNTNPYELIQLTPDERKFICLNCLAKARKSADKEAEKMKHEMEQRDMARQRLMRGD